MAPKRIAQASSDPALARTRSEVLRNAGYNVETFETCEQLAEACRAQPFDVLIIGHKLEYPVRNDVCETFRKYNRGAKILQLAMSGEAPGEADFMYDIYRGPEPLLNLIGEIVAGDKKSTRPTSA